MCFCFTFFPLKESGNMVRDDFKQLLAEISLSPYRSFNNHAWHLLDCFSYALKALFRLLYVVGDVLLTLPAILLSPCELPKVPLVVGCHLLSSAINMLAVGISPITLAARTASSVILGYTKAEPVGQAATMFG